MHDFHSSSLLSFSFPTSIPISLHQISRVWSDLDMWKACHSCSNALLRCQYHSQMYTIVIFSRSLSTIHLWSEDVFARLKGPLQDTLRDRVSWDDLKKAIVLLNYITALIWHLQVSIFHSLTTFLCGFNYRWWSFWWDIIIWYCVRHFFGSHIPLWPFLDLRDLFYIYRWSTS
mgnify:CR=1